MRIPGEPQIFGFAQQLLNAADADFGAPADSADRQSGRQSKTKNISDFTHSDPCSWHRLSKKIESVPNSQKINALKRFPVEAEHSFRDGEQ